MKEFYLKKNKKIKILIQSEILRVFGPLGYIDFKLKKQFFHNKNDFDYFIKNKDLKYFKNIINSLFKSVTKGWFGELSLYGVGYKCFKELNQIILDVGYSNLIYYKYTHKIKIKVLKNKIIFFSLNRDYLNNVIFLLKNYAIPDLYKGKGILLKNEIIKLKKKK